MKGREVLYLMREGNEEKTRLIRPCRGGEESIQRLLGEGGGGENIRGAPCRWSWGGSLLLTNWGVVPRLPSWPKKGGKGVMKWEVEGKNQDFS